MITQPPKTPPNSLALEKFIGDDLCRKITLAVSTLTDLYVLVEFGKVGFCSSSTMGPLQDTTKSSNAASKDPLETINSGLFPTLSQDTDTTSTPASLPNYFTSGTSGEEK